MEYKDFEASVFLQHATALSIYVSRFLNNSVQKKFQEDVCFSRNEKEGCE